MKNLKFKLTSFSYLSFILLFIFQIDLIAATNKLNNDQNPNYKRSMKRYMSISDSLISTQGTTIQNTYVAIDEYKEKIDKKIAKKKQRKEKKAIKKAKRKSSKYNRISYIDYSSDYYYSPYNYNSGLYYNNMFTPYTNHVYYGINPYYNKAHNNHYNYYYHSNHHSPHHYSTNAAYLGLGIYWGLHL